MSQRAWPDGDDAIAAELRRALDEAQRRVPDDVTLRRGWAAIGSHPTAGRRGARLSWFVGGVASTAALTLACAAWLWPRVVNTPAAPERAQAVVQSAQAPATAETRRLTLDGGVEAELQQTSVMRIEGSGARVEDGAVRFKVPRRRPGHPFVVRAEAYRVVVIGTRFGVAVNGAVNGDRQVDVDVDEGVVEVWDKDVRLARLAPGQRWNSVPPAAPKGTSAAEPTGEAADKAGEAADKAGEAADKAGEAGPLDKTPAPAVEPETSLVLRSDARRRRTTSPRGAGRVASLAAPARASVESPSAARAALAAGDAPRAIEIYKTLAQKTGPVAENAAYEIGRIQNERGQSAAAVATWRRYRADYPNGILRVEADVSIIETLAKGGETDEALTEATDFLRRRPDSERRGEIARVAGDLYRSRGDCRHAIGAYQLAQSASRARDVVEAATFHRAACLVRVGDGGGADAVRGYLRAYPEGRFKRQAAELVEQAATKH